MINPKTPEEIQEDQEALGWLNSGALKALQNHREILRVYRTSTGYVVDFTGTADEGKMQELFDSPILPSGYTAQAPASVVRDGLQTLNPQYKVEVCGYGG